MSSRDGIMSSRLRYWHPVLPARELRPRRVRAVKLAGHAIAIFRAENGNLGAVTDQCAHRRMKLSLGRVKNGRLVCPYHGWSFSDSGAGESPSAPKMHACLTSYDCAEAFGVIWLRARGSEQPLPDLLPNEGNFAGPVFNRVNAPLQLVIDNFSEVEHTVTMHPQFGFDPQRASEAVAELTTTNDAVTMCNRGPA